MRFLLLLALVALAAGARSRRGLMDGLADIGKDIGKGITKEVAAVKQPIDATLTQVGSSQCDIVKKVLGVAYDQVEQKEPDLNQITLEYRDGKTHTVYNITTAAEMIPLSPDFNPRQKLVIFIHGFVDDPKLFSFKTINDAFLSKGDYNVLALDASSLIRWMYLRSTTYVRFIGEKLGGVLAALAQNHVDPAQIHIIGHSLGAHISGFAGKTFSALTGAAVGRISGLDPAGPCFAAVGADLRLKASDAAFVDIMHTDDNVFGLEDPVGHVDYYPNGGQEQPTCLTQTCSHNRAWVYYAESVSNPAAFPAVSCASWEDFRAARCDYDNISYMGYPAAPPAKSRFYLQTKDEAPFGAGEVGTHYRNNEGVIKNVANMLG